MEDFKIQNGRQRFFSDNDDYCLLRQHMHDLVAKHIVPYLQSRSDLKVLEIGPEGVYETNVQFPELGTSPLIKQACCEGKHKYFTLDVIEDINTSFVGSIEHLQVITKQRFDVIVALSVLEHVQEPWEAARQMYACLETDGVAFLNTPLMFKVHGPIPDFWRFTQYGYEALFGNKFDLEFLAYPEDQLGKNTAALSLNVIARKK
jgi:hypothetical protein